MIPSNDEFERLEKIGNDLLELQYQARLLRLKLTLEMTFDPDQPRVPAGRPDGGEWTSGGSQNPGPEGSEPPPGKIVDRVLIPGDMQGPGAKPDAKPSDAAQSESMIDLVQYRGQYHDQVRNDLAYYLTTKGAIVQTEVPVTLLGPAPVTAVLDIMVKNPDTSDIYGIEVKTEQDPKYTPAQQIVYPHMQTGGLVASFDNKIRSFGLLPIMPLPPIEMFVFYSESPGGESYFKPMIPSDLGRSRIKHFDTNINTLSGYLVFDGR